LDVGLGRLARIVKDGDLPAPWPAEVIDKLLHKDAVTAASDRRGTIEYGGTAVGAERLGALALPVVAQSEAHCASRADDLLVVAQQRRSHRAGWYDIGLGGERPE